MNCTWIKFGGQTQRRGPCSAPYCVIVERAITGQMYLDFDMRIAAVPEAKYLDLMITAVELSRPE